MFNKVVQYINLHLIKQLVLAYKTYILAFIGLIILFSVLIVGNQRGELLDASPTSSSDIIQNSDKPKIFVDVEGAVRKPGLYQVQATTRVGELLKLAGGLLESVDAFYFYKAVNLASVLKDGDKVYIPFEWEYYEATASTALAIDEYIIPKYSNSQEETRLDDTDNQSGKKDTTLKVNVNTSSQDGLDSLMGIGSAYATKIINSRPYKDFSELVSKSGVPAATLTKIQTDIEF